MFPEEELEQLLRLVERLQDRISQIDDLGLLDASVLGEVVHPRTFNTLRRIRQEDGAVLDEEEARAELAGPEVLLKQLLSKLPKAERDTPLYLQIVTVDEISQRQVGWAAELHLGAWE